MSYSFVSGSVKKSEFYDFLLNAMIAAGWKNVSGNTSKDGDVMYSNGVSGTEQIYVQFRPFADNGNDSVSIKKTRVPYMSFRLQPSYTPGASGEAGTVYAASRMWEVFPVFNPCYAAAAVGTEKISIDEGIQYYLSVDKDKLILFTKGRPEISPFWQFNYIGLPDSRYYIGDKGRGVVAGSHGGVGNVGSYSQDGSMHFIMSEYPDSRDGINANADRHWFGYTKYIAPCNITPNANNRYFFSEVYIGDDKYGMMGKLDGIYIANSRGLNSGDKVTINSEEYTIFRCDSVAANEMFNAPHRTSESSYEGLWGRGCLPYPGATAMRNGALDTIAIKI